MAGKRAIHANFKRKKFDETLTFIKKQRIEETQTLTAVPLNLEILSDNVKVLGVIAKVFESKLLISLPAGYYGIVSATNVSSQYTNLMMKCLENPEERKIHTLEEMFSVGCTVVCRVMDVMKGQSANFQNTEETSGCSEIILTLYPEEVNFGLKSNNLHVGMVLSAAVVSQEDHGYVMDLGIKSQKVFMKINAAEEYEKPLLLGKVLPILITSIENGCVYVTCDPKLVVKAKVTKEMKLNIHTIVPGMRVMATVTWSNKSGVGMKFLGLTGAAHRRHLLESCTVTQEYKEGDEVDAWVLYVEQLSKTVYVSFQRHLKSPQPFNLFKNIKHGAVIEKAVVTEMHKNCVFLRIRNEFLAICKKNKFPNSFLTTGSNWRSLLQTQHRCRVIGFNPMDGLLIVTMKPEQIAGEYFSYNELNAGDLVKVNVKKRHGKGLQVALSSWITGIIPTKHIELKIDPETNKVVPLPKQLECRVLNVDPTKKLIIFTNRKELVETEIPLLTSYENVVAGQIVQGIVRAIWKHYITVTFYNNVYGTVGKEALLNAGIRNPTKQMSVNQLVTCKVLECDPNVPRLFLAIKCVSEPMAIIIGNDGKTKKRKNKIVRKTDEKSQMNEGKFGEKSKMIEEGKSKMIGKRKIERPSRYNSRNNPLPTVMKKRGMKRSLKSTGDVVRALGPTPEQKSTFPGLGGYRFPEVPKHFIRESAGRLPQSRNTKFTL